MRMQSIEAKVDHKLPKETDVYQKHLSGESNKFHFSPSNGLANVMISVVLGKNQFPNF